MGEGLIPVKIARIMQVELAFDFAYIKLLITAIIYIIITIY